MRYHPLAETAWLHFPLLYYIVRASLPQCDPPAIGLCVQCRRLLNCAFSGQTIPGIIWGRGPVKEGEE